MADREIDLTKPDPLSPDQIVRQIRAIQESRNLTVLQKWEQLRLLQIQYADSLSKDFFPYPILGMEINQKIAEKKRQIVEQAFLDAFTSLDLSMGKINFKGTLKELLFFLKSAVEQGKIDPLSPKQIATLFLLNGEPINPRSISVIKSEWRI